MELKEVTLTYPENYCNEEFKDEAQAISASTKKNVRLEINTYNGGGMGMAAFSGSLFRQNVRAKQENYYNTKQNNPFLDQI